MIELAMQRDDPARTGGQFEFLVFRKWLDELIRPVIKANILPRREPEPFEIE
jgi:hypothetical protein